MANIHTFLHRIYIRTLRFRHRNGYGVHSPFAYNLIKGVIYESHMYYAYPELARMRGSYAGRLSVSGRMDRLMFRLANYVRPEKAAIVGRNRGVTGKYVAAGNAGRQPGRHGRQTVRPLLCRTRRGRLRGIHELCPRRRAAKPFCGGGNIRHARRTQELGEHTQRPALGGDIRPLRGRTRVFQQQAEQAKPYSKFLKNHYFGP